MEIFKTAKVTFDFIVTMVTAYIGELWNALQKIPRKILGKLVKFWLLNPKNTWGADSVP